MKAKQELKWILVNILSPESFSSHELNRDTWSDDTVQSVIEENFVLWIRSNKSIHGLEYVKLHCVPPEDIPIIAIVDPRTGAQIIQIKVRMFSIHPNIVI